MSGFQIPGLGNAKPGEKLPPLPADHTVTAATVTTSANHSEDVQVKDAPAAADQSKPQEAKPETTTAHDQQQQDPDADSMAVDQPASPPSLTDALEAALGGIPGEDAEVALAQAQSQLLQAQPQVQQEGGEGAEDDHPEWEVDSSPYVSSSESSESSDSSSDEDSDAEGYELLGVQETARMLMEAEGGSDDEGDRGGRPEAGAAHLRTKNEQPDEPIPRPDVTITPEMKVEELGVIEHIVEDMVLIKAFTPGEYQVLDSGSVLCNADRVVIGAVAETIGKVVQPMYTVRFSSADEVVQLGLEVGSKISYPVDHANFVFTEPLKNLKGSDASNLHDEEVGDDEMEFSDDEKEAEYKRAAKEKRKKKAAAARGGAAATTAGNASQKGPHPLRREMSPSGELNYDDDGPYRPLTRPPGFGDGPVSQETYDPHPRGHRGGRGGRGDSRGGRGGRRGRGGGNSNGINRGGRQDGYSLPPAGAPPPPPSSSSSSQYQPHQQHPPQQNTPAVPPPPPGWQPGGAPAMPNFGINVPGWPQQGAVAPPPPPPGWPGSVQGQVQAQGQAQGQNVFVNPALLAALMSHMQQQQQHQGQQPQWPPGGQGQ
ncbi:H/ACA ribonucleoprotein complex non-core subunit NAF1 [Geosmithia morbida]|uniref:H/ACA ribonucleoprotein complex non-core subunit NAF1 n=1 Tax=Geosmithia morbida TaxID=1094350 RepID=A0A9P5D879_9HYPO|nr:H/ACA ribonucleoprotein complex non-core subunit NAF1 [Geosmithia morbida]KAF4126515.1 H/ACA ribonucleoprotein complex non-core subunit NAF1 [Geosmithia morbida]